jgi:hypothetical protein
LPYNSISWRNQVRNFGLPQSIQSIFTGLAASAVILPYSDVIPNSDYHYRWRIDH